MFKRATADTIATPIVDSFGVTFIPTAGALTYLTMVLDLREAHGGRQPLKMLEDLIKSISKATRVTAALSSEEEYQVVSDRETRSNFRSSADADFLGGPLPSDWRGLTVVQFKQVFAVEEVDTTATVTLSARGVALRVVGLTQAEYDALTTKDADTMYLITD